jgi:hypothetical protein
VIVICGSAAQIAGQRVALLCTLMLPFLAASPAVEAGFRKRGEPRIASHGSRGCHIVHQCTANVMRRTAAAACAPQMGMCPPYQALRAVARRSMVRHAAPSTGCISSGHAHFTGHGRTRHTPASPLPRSLHMQCHAVQRQQPHTRSLDTLLLFMVCLGTL